MALFRLAPIYNPGLSTSKLPRYMYCAFACWAVDFLREGRSKRHESTSILEWLTNCITADIATTLGFLGIGYIGPYIYRLLQHRRSELLNRHIFKASAMALKRKRSSSFYSPVAQSTTMTTTFTPLSSAESPTRTLFGTGDISMGDISTPHQLHQIHNWSMTINPMYDENNPPAGLNSRTRKRLRDGRPDESLIHGRISHLPLSPPTD